MSQYIGVSKLKSLGYVEESVGKFVRYNTTYDKQAGRRVRKVTSTVWLNPDGTLKDAKGVRMAGGGALTYWRR